MVITEVIELSKSRSKVYLDGEFAFVLYKGELSRYKIKEKAELDEDTFYKIKNDIIIKRAKKRTLHLLEQMNRSEQQIRLKLKQSYYTEDVIEMAINYAKDFGYIKDELYAQNLVQWKQGSKSKKEIYFTLLQKGIQKETAQEVLEQAYEHTSEEEAILKLIRKKGYDLNTLEKDQLRKLNGFLMRKGFGYDQIRNVLEKEVKHLSDIR